MRTTDIHIREVAYSTEFFRYRTPIKFGGQTLDRVTLLNAAVTVESPAGRRATGRGSMPLGNVWAYPTSHMSYEQTLAAMCGVADRVAEIYSGCTLRGHPFEITWQVEPDFFAAAADLSAKHADLPPIPRLATLVAASPFDAALHDAYGKLHGVSAYQTYGADFWDDDLGRLLGEDFRGEHVSHHVLSHPVESLPLYHLVGALDPLADDDLEQPVGDGLPETLGQWIAYSGLTHLKIKLNGDDLRWDVERVLAVERVAVVAQARRNVTDWHYSLDFNEKCRSVDYLLQFLAQVRAAAPRAYTRIAYIEQPTARDLTAHHQNRMHAASAQIPVVIDESLLDLESLLFAREMGYTGIALKACKGQTQSIVLACAARQLGLFLCVQDLTCPGASLIHSAGLAAHVRGVTAIEANSRQYCPAANADWIDRFPGIFDPHDGRVQTHQLIGPGLSAYPSE